MVWETRSVRLAFCRGFTGLFSPAVFSWCLGFLRRECVNSMQRQPESESCPSMRTPLLEILTRNSGSFVRVEGRRFRSCDRAALFIVAMVGGANSYRQMHEFIRIHRQSISTRLQASQLTLCAVLHRACGYTPARRRSRRIGERLSAPRVDRSPEPPANRRASAIAVTAKPGRGSFDAFCDRKGRAYDDGVAPRRPNRARACDGCGKEQRNPDPAPELNRSARRRRIACSRSTPSTVKNRSRVIKSGNHLLTQVKDNQPGLRRKLELGSAGRKPRDSAQSVTEGRNRHETRRLEVFDAKAWFARTPWEPLIKTVLRLTASCIDATPPPDFGRRAARPFSGSHRRQASRQSYGTPGFAGIGASRTAAITCATQPSPRTRRASARTPTFAARLRYFAYNLLRAHGSENIKNARWRAALISTFCSISSPNIKN